jgi:hypothetical protein
VLEKVLEELCTPESIAEHGGHEVDFIFCVGDDRSDEDMFQFLKRWKSKTQTYREREGGGGRESEILVVRERESWREKEVNIESKKAIERERGGARKTIRKGGVILRPQHLSALSLKFPLQYHFTVFNLLHISSVLPVFIHF